MNASLGSYVMGGPPHGLSGMVSAYPESEDQARLRFQVELEFVQCLANPNYLNFLAQRGYLKEKPFVNYLKYLMYWKNPEYAAYLKYPQSLHLLELLQYEGFRTEIINTPCAKFIEDQLLLHWQHYSRKRLKLLEQHAATDGNVAVTSLVANNSGVSSAAPTNSAGTPSAGASLLDQNESLTSPPVPLPPTSVTGQPLSSSASSGPLSSSAMMPKS